MKKRIAKKIIKQTFLFGNWDTDRQPYTIPQQRKAFKVVKITKLDFTFYAPIKNGKNDK